MQDRYAGDVGDYGKYGLLRALCGPLDFGSGLRIGMAWYRVPDESHNNDGRHVGYLDPKRAPRYRPCDPDLYDRLRRLVARGRRSVARIERLGILPAGTLHAPDLLDYAGVGPAERRRRRREWFDRVLGTIGQAELVLVAADNGLEVSSAPIDSPRGSKYAFHSEIARLGSLQRSLVVYQHIDRSGPVAAQIRRRTAELERVLPRREILAFRFHRGSGRIFYLIPSPVHLAGLEQRIERFLGSAWFELGHFSLAPRSRTSVAGTNGRS